MLEPEQTAASLRMAVPGKPVVKSAQLVPLSHSALFVTFLFGLAVGILAGYNPTYAAPPATVTVVAEVMAPILKDKDMAVREPIRLVGQNDVTGMPKAYRGAGSGMSEDVLTPLARPENEAWNRTRLPYEARP